MARDVCLVPTKEYRHEKTSHNWPLHIEFCNLDEYYDSTFVGQISDDGCLGD